MTVPQAGSARGGLTHLLKGPLVFDGRSTPVKTTLFLVVCLAWVLPGLIGHDPWKNDEAIAFGIIHSMLKEGHWLLPMVAGEPSFEYPPLYHWVAAATAWLTQAVLPLHDGARLASGLFMAVTIYFVHKTAKRLFDERAGRIAVLLLLGCLGLVMRAHEMNPEVAGLAGFAIALYGLTRLRADPRRGAVVSALGAGVMALSIGIVPALVVPLIAFITQLFMGDVKNRDLTRGIALMLLMMYPLVFWYPAALWFSGRWESLAEPALLGDMLIHAPLLSRQTLHHVSPLYWLQTLPWFALPALPLALWAWTKDRRILRERVELALPLMAFVVTLCYFSLVREARFIAGFALLPPLALAGAYALDRLPRGLARFIDSFSLLLFGLLAVGTWFYWSAAVTGWPATPARKVYEQVPDFTFSFQLVAFLIAAALTLIWLYAVIRAHRNNRRAVVNWTAGVTVIWAVANALALPAVDHVRSYRALALSVKAQRVTDERCTASRGVADAIRASFDYFAGIRLTAVGAPGAARCAWLLTQGTRERASEVDHTQWTLRWEGARAGDKVERLRLYQRVK